jgi:hypothetical protein
MVQGVGSEFKSQYHKKKKKKKKRWHNSAHADVSFVAKKTRPW